MAFNEEANIGRLLTRLRAQKLKKVAIAEIIVVVSGCTDGTAEIVRDEAERNRKIKLLIQKKREGKASAVNLFIRRAKSTVLIMVSADTLPARDAIEKLALPFRDAAVGMTAAHIIPVNQKKNFLGFYAAIFWKLHHEIAKASFKAGEMVAWRNVIPAINARTSTDETNIAALILRRGLKTVYVPQALVYNRSPENLADLIKVRRRHIAAYYHLREKVGISYIPDTMDNYRVIGLFLKSVQPKNLKQALWAMGVVLVEVLGRLAAWYDWKVRGEHHPIWQVAPTTKVLPKGI